jgi:hypothetical protein
MKKLTAKEIAEHYRVEKRVAQGWIQKGYFPNAIKEGHPIFGDVWLVPASDLANFVLPSAGRPRKERKAA